MLRGTIEAMVGTLSKSVADIQAQGGDADLLAKTYKEFTEGVAGAVEADLNKRAPVDEPLYKGLGTVGRVAGLLQQVAEKVEAVKAGYDNKYQMPSETGPANRATPTDVPTEDVVDLLDGVVHMAELALRAAVNEHVQLADDDDLAAGASHPEGMVLLRVFDGTDSETGAMVKTTLPMDLAKLATDPLVLQQAVIEQGLANLAAAGISEAQLSKLFETGDLNKSFPPKKKPDGSDDDADPAGGTGTGDPSLQATPPGAGGTDAAANPADSTATDSTDPSSGVGGGDSDPNGDDPLSVAMRIWAALGIQLQHIMALVTGDVGDDTGQAADPGTDLGQGGDPVTKAVRTLDLAKRSIAAPAEALPSAERAAVDQLAKRADKTDELLGELAKGMALLLAQPAAPKGAVRVIDAPPKQGDTGAALSKSNDEAVAAMQAELEKMSPNDRALALTKISQRMPEPNHRHRA